MPRRRSLELAAAALVAMASASGCGSGDPPAPAAAQCVSGTELCNGLDDDCDGEVDEELGTDACGVGECAVTVAACGEGAAIECRPRAPGTETCNGLDDDCDGTPDEGCACTPDARRACYGGPDGTAGVGECREGVQDCGGGGQWGACAGEVLPRDETCNRVDDDCDGVVDEGCACAPGETRACYAGPPDTAGVGECRAGAQTCDGGQWAACVGEVVPRDETCNGVDDDCDGSSDEGCACTPGEARACYAGPPDTAGVGECRAGAQRCDSGQWGTCVGEVVPRDETCNDVDDDCDGSSDEGCLDPTPVGTVTDARR